MHFIVLGAGPAGLASAILLARKGHTVDLFDKASNLHQQDEESYPIGVNPRGLAVIEAINPALRQDLEDLGRVAAWEVFSGARRLAHMPSKQVIGATRGRVVNYLLKEATGTPALTLHLGQKLSNIDLSTKAITFETTDGQELTVDGSNCRLIACDGVWSRARQALEAQGGPEYRAEVTPWQCHFRVLLSAPNRPSTLDPTIHYIFADRGIYCAILTGNRWAIVLQVKDTDPDRDILLAETATPNRIAYLKEFVQKNCAPAVPMIPDNEYTEYFSRRTFTGAVVQTERLAYKEWLVLLGDSAHAVLPPAGEGINCALEDCGVLLQCLDDDPAAMFQLYHSRRHADVSALGKYARVLRDGWFLTGADKSRQLVCQILMAILTKVGVFRSSWADKSFGVGAATYGPYREMYREWERQMGYVRPVATAFVAIGQWAGRLTGVFRREPKSAEAGARAEGGGATESIAILSSRGG